MKIKHGFEGERYFIIPYQFVSSMHKNPLCGDLYIHSLGHFANATYHYISRPNGTNEYILIYCKSGRGWVEVNGQRHEISENQVIIIPEGSAHSYGADSVTPWSIYWAHFMGSKAKHFAKGFESPVTIAPSENSRIEDRLKLFDEIYSVLNFELSLSNIIYANLCFTHFLATLSFVKQFRASKRRVEYSNTTMAIVVYYMHENLSNKLTIDDLSDYVGLSKSYFYRIFIQETGYPPIEYFNRMKIQKACEYLLYSNMKVVQISHMMGFADPYYFSRTFTKIMGVSPTKYRNNARELDQFG